MSRTSCHLSPSKSGVRSQASMHDELQNDVCISPTISATEITKKSKGNNPPIAAVKRDDTVSTWPQVTPKGSQQSIHKPTPSLPLVSGSEGEHSPIHYESFVRSFTYVTKNGTNLQKF